MKILDKIRMKKNTWVNAEEEKPTESGFYWIYDEYYHGVTIAFFDSTYGNGSGQWEVWKEKPDSVYRQTDIYVTHWKEFEEPGRPFDTT